MDLFYYSRIAYARSIAENGGLSLVEEKIDMPRTDGKVIYVPVYNTDWDDGSDEAINWWGKFLHEIYHNDKRFDHSDAFKILKDNRKDLTQMLKYCSNLIEDHRIEHNEWGEYPGRDRIMNSLRRKMFREFKEHILEKGTGNPKMDAVYWFQWSGFDQWLDIGFDSSIMPKDTQEYYDKIKDLLPELLELDSALSAWELSKKIMDILVDDSPKEKDTKKKGGESDSEDDGDDTVEADYGKFCEHKHTPDAKESGKPMKVKSSPTGMAHTPAKMAEINPDAVGTDIMSSSIAPKVKIDGLAAQIKRYLLVQTRSNMVNNQKAGKIDTASLWKASVYRNSASGSRVFQKELEHLNLDTAVSLLVDQSGSMAGSKYYNAAAAATVLNEVFSRIGVKTRITGFTDDPRETYCVVHKDFNEKVEKNKLIQRFSRAGSWRMSGNADGENILWEFNKLSKRNEKKKIIIVLSDGEPADSKWGDIYTFTSKVIKEIEKSPVKIIGIGIESNAVERFYKIHKVLKHSAEIENTLLEILKKEVIHE